MPEILPNWHPAAVHFPIALSAVATLLLLAGKLRPENALHPASGRLLLGLAALSALLAAGLGWHAYATVEHDAAGHRVMTEHRNWALGCTAGLLFLGLWDALRQRDGKPPHAALLPALLLISGGLGVTGWLGGEMVYRHGIGVMPSAFYAAPASPESAPAAAVSAPTAEPVPVPPPPVPGEHIHKDGKRHRH